MGNAFHAIINIIWMKGNVLLFDKFETFYLLVVFNKNNKVCFF